jgi:hydroxymethylpyrimidine pyrophosphatase-like HAD family hydrolase
MTEPRPEIRLILTDIEGCLMPAERGVACLGDLAPIAAYCDAARRDSALPPLVLCTGRQIPYAECVAQVIGAFFPGMPSVVENGAFLYDIARGELIPSPAITAEALAQTREVREDVDRLLARVGGERERGKEVCISLNPPAGTSVEQLHEVVTEELARWADAVAITHSRSAVDITPLGVDKGSAIENLAAVTGIPTGAILGIGDTRGDLPMLEKVGIAAAPANASPEVRGCAQYTATQPGPAGVAEILREFTQHRT